MNNTKKTCFISASNKPNRDDMRRSWRGNIYSYTNNVISCNLAPFDIPTRDNIYQYQCNNPAYSIA